MRLADFPAGGTLLLDANCLIYHFTGTYPSCALLLARAQRRELRVLTSAATLVEVRHRLVIFEAEVGLLTNDALIVATMRAHRLVHLASNDTDFTRVAGIILWRP